VQQVDSRWRQSVPFSALVFADFRVIAIHLAFGSNNRLVGDAFHQCGSFMRECTRATAGALGLAMKEEQNSDGTLPTAVVPSKSGLIGTIAILGLTLPTLIIAVAWGIQWFVKFPPRSLGASLTALVLLLGLSSAFIQAFTSVARLVRSPALRSPKNVLRTIVAMLLAITALFIVIPSVGVL